MIAEFLVELDKPPRQSFNQLWSDYVELRCLLHPDKYFTLDSTEEALHEADDYISDSEEHHETSSSEGLDKLSLKWGECERIINRRAELLGDSYPFIPSSSYQGIELRDDGSEDLKNWYKFLLLASSLRYVNGHNKLTTAFELASHEIFKKLHAANTEVHGFWPGAHHYPTDKAGRFKKLAEDLRTVPTFPDNAFSDRDKGDGGIDLVAWHPLGDKRNRMPISIGQCGCSVDDWKSKPMSVMHANLCEKLAIPAHYLTYYFMPLDMSGLTDGQWADGTGDLPSTIVMDRIRIINIAREHAIALPKEAFEQLVRLDGCSYK